MLEKLNNSPITTAVLEIVFKKDLEWDLTIPGFLFEKIKSKFPEKRSVVEGVAEFYFDSKSSKEPIQNFSKEEVPQFLTAEKNIFVLVKKNNISIHHLKDYTSWSNYKALINFVYSNYVEIVKETAGIDLNLDNIARIGLRYINEIKITKKDFKIEDYFNYRPALINPEDKLEAFILGNIYNNNQDSIKVQLNTAPPSEDSFNFVLDTDYFTTKVEQNVIDWIENAHTKIEDTFVRALTEKTINIFK